VKKDEMDGICGICMGKETNSYTVLFRNFKARIKFGSRHI
jgi:hypothetical protein